MSTHPNRLRIAIIGAGFSGSSLAAVLNYLTDQPLDLFLFEKSGDFGKGIAYSTPLAFHLLNVRVKDMSAFEDQPQHFLQWLKSDHTALSYMDKSAPLEQQFAPRFLYALYLKKILHDLTLAKKINIHFIASEVIDITPSQHDLRLILHDKNEVLVDKVVLGTGNNLPMNPPFPASPKARCINNPWDFAALKQIKPEETVLITGTGLSMVDAVLTLHHQHHQGKIYALSRHGLLPLPHSDTDAPIALDQQQLPEKLIMLSRVFRMKSTELTNTGGDWRSLVNGIRLHIPFIWQRMDLRDKKQFLRHLLPYWNIHRHRVPEKVAKLLTDLQDKNQLEILAGRVQEVAEGVAVIKERHTQKIAHLPVAWLINCIGPSLNIKTSNQPLIQSLIHKKLASFDPLNLGINTTIEGALIDASGVISSSLYALGPPTKGATWESVSVPDIRKQSYSIAKHLLGKK